MKKVIAAVFLIVFVILVRLTAPVYGFFAHQGEAPFTPFGWTKMRTEAAPNTNEALDPLYADAGSRVLALMEKRRQDIGAPAFSAAVAIEGKIVWRGTTGWADMASGTPATPDTKFRIGSTSKALTATALARLVESGAVDLDAPISIYLEKLPNEAWETITPRMLASHMAGIPHYGDNTEKGGLYRILTMNKHYSDVRDAVGIFDESDLLFEPGTSFEYSSLGTVLLGAVMSEAADKPYRQIIEDEVLKPARAKLTEESVRKAKQGENYATFYYRNGVQYRAWRPTDLSHRLPGGGYASTSSDLVRIGSLQFDPEFIDPSVRAEFWTPQRLNNGEVNEQDYALGWRWREFEVPNAGIARNANHGGVSRGGQSWLMVLPEYNMVIALNVNIRTDVFWNFGSFYEDVFREFTLVEASSPVER